MSPPLLATAPDVAPPRGGQQSAGFTPSPPSPPGVIAPMGYLRPTTLRPCNYMYEPPTGTPWSNCEFDLHPMTIGDARASSLAPSIHREGFELWDAPSSLHDFFDEDAVLRNYYPEMAELARAVTGGQRAVIFDHQVRRREAGRPALAFGRQGDGSNPAAVGRVHNDYSEESGRRRLALVLGSQGIRAPVRHFSIVNIWRSIAGPVEDTPLAVCDARSIAMADLVPAEIRYPDRSGEIFLVEHAAEHRWAYFSRMDRHEALVFKQYDSRANGVARFTPHAAFDLPDVPPDAPLRQSIELRCLVIHD